MLLQHSYPVISYKIPRSCALSVGGLVGYTMLMPTAEKFRVRAAPKAQGNQVRPQRMFRL